MTSAPLVSLLMAAYNAAPFIGAAVESVIAQTVRDWELIIVDDASTDATAEIAACYAAADPRIRLIRHDRPSGVCIRPRLTAARVARAPFFLDLDADDLIEPEFLAKLLERQAATGAGVVIHQLWNYYGPDREPELYSPAPDFDLTRTVTGREALLLMLDCWRIPGNYLIAREVYLTGAVPAELLGNQNADELPALLGLMEIPLVAFAPARYFYRVNPDSMSRCRSLRRLDIIESDLWVIDDAARRYPDDGELRLRLEYACYRDLRNRYMEGYPACLDVPDRPMGREIMRRAHRILDLKAVGRLRRGLKYRVMCLGYGPARLILGLYGRIRRK